MSQFTSLAPVLDPAEPAKRSRIVRTVNGLGTLTESPNGGGVVTMTLQDGSTLTVTLSPREMAKLPRFGR